MRRCLLDVDTLKAKIKDAYAKFTSYEDSGIIRCPNHGRGDGWFKTKFLRPNLLIYQWCTSSEDEDKQTLLVKGERGRVRVSKGAAQYAKPKDLARVEHIDSVNMAMSLTGGPSFGLSDVVLPLLILDSQRPSFLHKKCALLGDEELDGKPCYHLREIFEPFHIWVSKEDFTVCRAQSDGCSIMNEALEGVFNICKTLSPKSFNDAYETPTSADWHYKSVKYNHLDEADFQSFSLDMNVDALET